MKLTLLLLLLPALTFAQYPPSQSLPDAYMLGDTTYRMFLDGTPISMDESIAPGSWMFDKDLMDCVYLEQFLPRLLADWEAYKQECEPRWIFTPARDSVSYKKQVEPDLPGFMQYLTTRLERKEITPYRPRRIWVW